MTTNIAIQQNHTLDDDVEKLLNLEISSDIRMIESDDYIEYIIINNCNMDTLIEILENFPYLNVELNDEPIRHTGVDLDIKLILYLDFSETDL